MVIGSFLSMFWSVIIPILKFDVGRYKALAPPSNMATKGRLIYSMSLMPWKNLGWRPAVYAELPVLFRFTRRDLAPAHWPTSPWSGLAS